jgi:hypothetical protein
MAVRLNKDALAYGEKLIESGKYVSDDRGAWSEDKPSTQEENGFIEEHGYEAYGRWHLGINDDEPEDTKARYEFPYGDFKNAHRCGILSAESRAGQYKHVDIENAASLLHAMIDERAELPQR